MGPRVDAGAPRGLSCDSTEPPPIKSAEIPLDSPSMTAVNASPWGLGTRLPSPVTWPRMDSDMMRATMSAAAHQELPSFHSCPNPLACGSAHVAWREKGSINRSDGFLARSQGMTRPGLRRLLRRRPWTQCDRPGGVPRGVGVDPQSLRIVESRVAQDVVGDAKRMPSQRDAGCGRLRSARSPRPGGQAGPTGDSDPKSARTAPARSPCAPHEPARAVVVRGAPSSCAGRDRRLVLLESFPQLVETGARDPRLPAGGTDVAELLGRRGGRRTGAGPVPCPRGSLSFSRSGLATRT